MKRFIIKVSFFLTFYIVVATIASSILDPYNVFHWKHIRNNGVEPNKNYIKTKYILSNPDKYDGFLFGSSRVGAIHVENIDNGKIYNMTYSAGTPREHLETLKTFIAGHININVVYVGIDSHSYTEDPKEHYNQPMRCPYEKLDLLHMIRLYIDPSLAFQNPAVNAVENNNEMDSFYEYGWWCDYNRTTSIDWSKAEASVGESYLLDETLQDIQDIKDLCDKSNIKLVVFTNPMYELTYQKSLKMNYLEFLERLATIIDYYNFSGINDVTVNTDNYIDSSHYNAYVGDMLINVMVNGEKYDNLYTDGFGWYVSKENVNELMEIIK